MATVIEFAEQWNAVLLLDDANAFVKTRSYCDGQYKNLVPIYQRILEYYDSVLFLNTNVPGGIDNAFESRVHLSSQYHGPATDTTEPERPAPGDFAKVVWLPKPYGRVGDSFQKAQILAMKLQTPMSLQHVRIVTRLREADAVELREPNSCGKRQRDCLPSVLLSKGKHLLHIPLKTKHPS